MNMFLCYMVLTCSLFVVGLQTIHAAGSEGDFPYSDQSTGQRKSASCPDLRTHVVDCDKNGVHTYVNGERVGIALPTSFSCQALIEQDEFSNTNTESDFSPIHSGCLGLHFETDSDDEYGCSDYSQMVWGSHQSCEQD